MRTYTYEDNSAPYGARYNRYYTPHDELSGYYDDGDYFSVPRRNRSKKRKKAKKRHGFRNFLLVLLVLVGVVLAAKHYGAGSPLSLLGLDIFGSGTIKPDTENVLVDYNVDLSVLDTQLPAVSTGYYPNEEEQGYLQQAREAYPKLSEKIDFLTRHIDSYSRGAILTLYLSPEKADYVLQDPIHSGEDYTGEKTISVKKGKIPLLVQYDRRWGNHTYGSGGMGNTGCGPTCLSMVAAGLTGDGSLTPDYVADFALNNGYYVEGSGTAWSLFTQGAAALGLNGRELPLDEEGIKSVLKDGGAVILSVTRGDFTFNGHFIVVCGISGDKFAVCDPSSIERSGELWDGETLLSQTAAAWALTV